MKQLTDSERALRLVEALAPHTYEMRSTTINGAPHSKGRHRHTRSGRPYMAAEDRNAEKETAFYLKRIVDQPLYGNLALACVFFRPNRQRIDCDNMLKHVCDAANGVLWHDDSQVTAIMGVVEYDPTNPRTVVVVAQHESSLVRDAATPVDCIQCGKKFTRRKARQTICSKKCRSEWQIGRNRSRASILDPKCQVCGALVSKPEVQRCRTCWSVRGSDLDDAARRGPE